MHAREYVNSNMAECMFNENKFSEGFDIACNLLQIPSFYHDQKEAFEIFFKGKDLFFSAHTGYGPGSIPCTQHAEVAPRKNLSTPHFIKQDACRGVHSAC